MEAAMATRTTVMGVFMPKSLLFGDDLAKLDLAELDPRPSDCRQIGPATTLQSVATFWTRPLTSSVRSVPSIRMR